MHDRDLDRGDTDPTAENYGSLMQEQPANLLRELEEDLTTNEFLFQRAKVFKKAANLYRNEGKTTEAERVELVGALFSFMLVSRTKRRPGGYGRFAPMIEMGGKAYPHVAAFPPDSLLAFKEELERSSNPIHRALYADFIWDQRDKYQGPRKDPYEAAKTAINAYLEAARIYRRNGWDDQLADALDRASELALSINDSQLIARCIQECFDFAQEFIAQQQHPAVRWVIDVLETLQSFDRQLSRHDDEQIVSLIEAGAEFYAAKRNRHLQRSFLELLPLSLRSIGTIAAADRARARSAETFVVEAEEADSAIVRLHLLGKAIEAYQQLGNSIRLDELKRRLSEAGVASLSEMQRVSVSVRIPNEIADAWVNQLLSPDLEDALWALSTTRRFVPNMNEVRADAATRRQQFPLQYLVSRSTLDTQGRIVEKANSEEEQVAASEADVYKGLRAMGDWELGRAFERLEAEKGLTAETLMRFLRSAAIFEPATLDVVGVGVQRYFAGDYVSALHVLVPQLEDTLRDILARLGQSRISVQQGLTRENP